MRRLLHDGLMIRRSIIFVSLCSAVCHAQTGGLRLVDAYPDKARYAPSEPINVVVETAGTAHGAETVRGTLLQLGQRMGICNEAEATGQRQDLRCSAPAKDFQGYQIEVELLAADGRVEDRRTTAIDVSSDWKRFPRYGYMAHYNAAEGTQAKAWIDELNKFHINGLEFYDFQFRHEHPLAGTVDHPAAAWKDIAGRPIDGLMVRELIEQAHAHNMMAMAYNASYSAYDDAFTRKSNPLPLAWATWSTADSARTAATAKKLELHADHWSTDSLYYMNQNSRDWQNYLYARMAELFKVYAFDGWHIDTFGEKGGYAFDGSYVDYVSGFPTFINRAHDALHKPIVFNAVNTDGQVGIARSDAELVYSELWEDHETFASLLTTADEVHLANPRDGVVFAAYVHRLETKDREARPAAKFNPPAVLLTDAALFAAGASHIELGDGNRMLSSEYFPADTGLTMGADLQGSLRSYYDFLTAYENYLRDETSPAAVSVIIPGQQSSASGIPDTLWTIARKTGNMTMVHVVNLLGSGDPHWRDMGMKRPEPPPLKNVEMEIDGLDIKSAGWASPDIDGGRYHPMTLRRKAGTLLLTLPGLQYWDTIFLSK